MLNTEFKPADRERYDAVFVATGAAERKLNTAGFDSPNVRYAVDVLADQNITDQNVVIVGGGLTGCELAYDLARKNKKVTIVEMMPTILNVEGLAASNYNMLIELLEYYDVDVLTNAQITSYENGSAVVDVLTVNEPNAKGRARYMSLPGVHHNVREIPADTVIVSVGYTSDQSLYEDIKDEDVFLLGDAVQPGNLMSAIWSAYTTALNV